MSFDDVEYANDSSGVRFKYLLEYYWNNRFNTYLTSTTRSGRRLPSASASASTTRQSNSSSTASQYIISLDSDDENEYQSQSATTSDPNRAAIPNEKRSRKPAYEGDYIPTKNKPNNHLSSSSVRRSTRNDSNDNSLDPVSTGSSQKLRSHTSSAAYGADLSPSETLTLNRTPLQSLGEEEFEARLAKTRAYLNSCSSLGDDAVPSELIGNRRKVTSVQPKRVAKEKLDVVNSTSVRTTKNRVAHTDVIVNKKTRSGRVLRPRNQPSLPYDSSDPQDVPHDDWDEAASDSSSDHDRTATDRVVVYPEMEKGRFILYSDIGSSSTSSSRTGPREWKLGQVSTLYIYTPSHISHNYDHFRSHPGTILIEPS